MNGTSRGWRELPRLRDGFLAGAFILVWLLPVLWTGLTDRRAPFSSNLQADLQSISCLFPNRQDLWNVFYIQVRVESEAEWSTVPLEIYSPMPLFGYRRRLEWLISESQWEPASGLAQREDLAVWIHHRWRFDHPDLPLPEAIRFVHGAVKVGRDVERSGRWRKPQLADLPDEALTVLSTHRF